jgi:hypothetical protein
VPLVLHGNGTAWSTVSGPDIGGLSGVVDAGPADVWAFSAASGGTSGVAHWDGTAWSTVSVLPSGTGVSVSAVSADGPNDIWAVSGGGMPHYDGTA